MFSNSLPILSLSLLSLSRLALAGSSCIAFDAKWNMLAFGFNGKDYNAGTQDTWGSGTATDITGQGRPPFNGANTTCYLSQFLNTIYVLGADNANPSSIYLYDADAKSWSTQSVQAGSLDLKNFDAILDHDTNVFYAYADGELWFLDMGNLRAANSTPVSWQDAEKLDLGAGYQPVMALAQNHVHFLNVPNLPNGSAKIFVIHFSFLQPDPQSYGNFPNTHGQATSFFKASDVQQEFAFIPDDGSATYVINVETNTTKTLKGPSVKDPLATYFASINSLVQLSSSGSVSFLAYDPSASASDAAGTSWSTVSKLPVASSSSSGSGSNSTSSSSSKSSSGSATGSTTGSAQGAGTTSNGAATSYLMAWSLVASSVVLSISLFAF